jgi:hypothetical protein
MLVQTNQLSLRMSSTPAAIEARIARLRAEREALSMRFESDLRHASGVHSPARASCSPRRVRFAESDLSHSRGVHSPAALAAGGSRDGSLCAPNTAGDEEYAQLLHWQENDIHGGSCTVSSAPVSALIARPCWPDYAQPLQLQENNQYSGSRGVPDTSGDEKYAQLLHWQENDIHGGSCTVSSAPVSALIARPCWPDYAQPLQLQENNQYSGSRGVPDTSGDEKYAQLLQLQENGIPDTETVNVSRQDLQAAIDCLTGANALIRDGKFQNLRLAHEMLGSMCETLSNPSRVASLRRF